MNLLAVSDHKEDNGIKTHDKAPFLEKQPKKAFLSKNNIFKLIPKVIFLTAHYLLISFKLRLFKESYMIFQSSFNKKKWP